jgi:tetratricopeptide (TPR) repeat protein
VDRAIELAPGYGTANVFRANLLACLGRSEEGLAVLMRYEEETPGGLGGSGWIRAMHYFYARRYDDAIGYLREGLLRYPRSAVWREFLGLAYSMNGMHEEALAQCDSMGVYRDRYPHIFLARAGRRAEAMAEFEMNRAAGDPYFVAMFFTAVGERDSALQWLDTAYAQKSMFLFWVRVEPFFDGLREDPRFAAFLKRMDSSG